MARPTHLARAATLLLLAAAAAAAVVAPPPEKLPPAVDQHMKFLRAHLSPEHREPHMDLWRESLHICQDEGEFISPLPTQQHWLFSLQCLLSLQCGCHFKSSCRSATSS